MDSRLFSRSENDFKNCEKFLCRLYKDLLSESLDNIRVRTPLISSKPEENPPTSNAGSFQIMHSIFQASRWEYAYLPYNSGLPPAIDYENTTLIKWQNVPNNDDFRAHV